MVLNVGGDFTIASQGDFEMTAVDGALAFGGDAGVGAANMTLVHTDHVEAWIGDSAVISVAGVNGLTVSAESSEDMIGMSVSGGFAGTAAIAGSATVLVLNETTSRSSWDAMSFWRQTTELPQVHRMSRSRLTIPR